VIMRLVPVYKLGFRAGRAAMIRPVREMLLLINLVAVP